ncbi:MAG TPA: 3-oxoacyl-[acyl-carrier-protein] reductase [Planctomycetota bacterium]|nr:3-oxoacyl-[acyl-carrier-protein] reductase [Planctomycetota bacterium]
MFRLDDKTALVTGASQGIGREIARSLADRGARVVAAARSEQKLESLCEEIVGSGGEAIPLVLDLGAAEEVPDRLGSLPESWRGIEVLVNNAGVTEDGLLARMSLEQWQRVLAINLTGAFALTKEVVRGMMRKRWGRIISISSVVGLMGNPGQANYAASKAGLVGFSKSLAKELGSRGITCNVVAPGFIETAMTEDLADKTREALETQIALRRLGTPADVAAAVLFLASEEAGYVTGEVLNVSGGLYM